MENNDNLMKKILADYGIQKRKEGREKAEDCIKSEQLQKLNSARRLRDSPPNGISWESLGKTYFGGASRYLGPSKGGLLGTDFKYSFGI